MNLLLALRNVVWRPWRSLLLLAGYGLGVAVMIVLLSIGEALVTQARDERLVGGGEITVLPEGIDIEVMKTGGLGGMFFSIDNARFIQLQLLASPRLAGVVDAVAPQIGGKLVYLRTDSAEFAVRAQGEIPSANAAVGAGTDLLAGSWVDDESDRRWHSPSAAELLHSIDHFHLPPPEVTDRDSWGEWHYFNVLSPERDWWAFISFILGGDVPDGEWGGQVLITLHERAGTGRMNGRVQRFASSFPPDSIEFSTRRADLRIGTSIVRVLEGGEYRVQAHAAARSGGGAISVDLTISPRRGAYFPGASIGGTGFTSGYAVPALSASANGSVCVSGACRDVNGAQAYHDHNWGVWRGVTWEWGSAQAGQFALLYGRVEEPGADLLGRPLFLYLVDSLGYRAIFRPDSIAYHDDRNVTVAGERVAIPRRATMYDVRGSDTLFVELQIEDAAVTDMRASLEQRGNVLAARNLERPFFIQMMGSARITGRVAGTAVSAEGAGFFETYRAAIGLPAVGRRQIP